MKRLIDEEPFQRPRATRISVAPVSIAEPATTHKGKKRKPEPVPTARAATVRERVHAPWDGTGAAYVTTTNTVPKTLRQVKARTGSHVESFQRDYEVAGSDLRSPSLESGFGANGLPLPLAKIQAVDRLKAFEKINCRAFTVCEAVLMFNARPTDLEKRGMSYRVATTMIQESIEALANFYTPAAKRPDKRLAVFARWVEEKRASA